MIVNYKKHYIAPQANSVKLNSESLLAGSNVTIGGDNTQPGAPTEAESKSSQWNSSDDWE